eukprot:3959136-Prymnesium_polylepis.5
MLGHAPVPRIRVTQRSLSGARRGAECAMVRTHGRLPRLDGHDAAQQVLRSVWILFMGFEPGRPTHRSQGPAARRPTACCNSGRRRAGWRSP